MSTPYPARGQRAKERAERQRAEQVDLRAALGITPADPSSAHAASGLPIRFVCTDRGTHKRTVLSFTLAAVPPAGARGGDPATVDHGLYNIQKCPRCDRHLQLRAEKMADALPELVANGFTELDISRMPF